MKRLSLVIVVFIMAIAPIQRAVATTPAQLDFSDCGVLPTPYFTVVYGYVFDAPGNPVASGSLLEIKNSRGDIVGCWEIEEEGVLAFTHIYGEDELGTPGMREGELPQYFVDGVQYEPSIELLWQNDWQSHRVDLTQPLHETSYKIYLPIISQ